MLVQFKYFMIVQFKLVQVKVTLINFQEKSVFTFNAGAVEPFSAFSAVDRFHFDTFITPTTQLDNFAHFGNENWMNLIGR